MHNHIKNLQIAFTEVFARLSYIALASVLAILAFLFAIWLPNIGLITDIFGTSSASLAAKMKVATSLLGGISTNFSALSASYTIAIAILFGINIAMVAYLLQKRTQIARQNIAAGFSGVASGVLGVGCAACGSFLLTAILSSFGAAGALALLPLQGGEFGILGVILLAVFLLLTARKITETLTCNSKPL